MADVIAAPAPVAAPAAAPAAATPTPVATPAPVATPTPVIAPGVDATPAVETPVTTEAAPIVTGDTPAAAVVKPGKPDKNDFAADDIEGFLAAMHKWDAEGGVEPEVKIAQPIVEDAPEVTTEPEVKTEPEAKVDAALDLTPQRVTEWTEKSPEFAALLEANPTLKGEVFAMARLNAKAAPILDIVGSAEEAKFAVDTANKFVDMRAGFAMANEDPARFGPAVEQFTDEFRIKDAAGNYVLDPATGKPQLAEDYGLIRDHFFNEQTAARTASITKMVTELKAKIDSAVYPSEAAKAADVAKFEDAEYTLSALQHLEQAFSPQGEAKRPALPDDASPEMRAWEESLKAREAQLEGNKQKTAQETRQAVRKDFEAKLDRNWNQGVGGYIDEQMKVLQGQGVYIPEFVLKQRWIDLVTGKENPGVSNFAATILQNFNAATVKDLDAKRRFATLQQLPVTPEAEAARVAFYKDLRAKHLPKVFQAEIDRIQNGIRNDRTAIEQGANKAARQQAASVEPATGSRRQPR
jgi:hypothetical protein